MKKICLILLYLALASQALIATRTWTNSKGQSLEAELLGIQGEQIKIKSHRDGRIYFYEISELSRSDQRYVQGLRTNSNQPNGLIQASPVARAQGTEFYSIIGLKNTVILGLVGFGVTALVLYFGAEIIGNPTSTKTHVSAIWLSFLITVVVPLVGTNAVAYSISNNSPMVYYSFLVLGLISLFTYWGLVSKYLTRGLFRALILIIICGVVSGFTSMYVQKIIIDDSTQQKLQQYQSRLAQQMNQIHNKSE